MAALLLASVTLAVAAPGPAALAGKRILVLAPYGFGRAGADTFVRHYVDGLVDGGVRVEDIMVEFLNLNRNVAPDTRKRLRDLLLAQYGGTQVDLVLALQQPALDFALTDLKDLAPAAPMVAFSGAAPPLDSLGRHTLLLQMPEVSFRGTLQQALRLFPDTERILVGVGTSASDQRAKQQIQSVVAELGLRTSVEYMDGLSFDGMAQRVANAPPHSIVLSAPMNRDLTGATATAVEMTVRLGRMARAPTFVLFSTSIGQGTLGGSVQHVEHLAGMIANASLALLSGARRPVPGITAMALPATSMYDWRQLQRWDSDWRRLPADTVFLNRPPSVWEQHGDLMLTGLGVIVLLSLLSGSLLLQRRRLRVAEARFRVLVEHAPEAIVVYDVRSGRFVDANSKAERLFAATRAQLLESGPERFYAEQQPDGMPAPMTVSQNAERSLAGEQMVFERSVRALDGRCFPCEVSLVALPSTSGGLLRGGFVDISERKRAEQALLHQSELLEAQVGERTAALSSAMRTAENANRAKSVFLANMSHELRTPLNSIIGFSKIMVESTSMFDEEKHNLAIINRSGHHLLSLINDILELSKIEAGQVRLLPAPLVLGELLREVHDMVRLAAHNKGVGLVIDAPAVPAVLVDGGKLRQVLLNLLSNAIKFTEAGTVTLALTVQPSDDAHLLLEFAVHDSGIGIAEAELERIFEPFVQADSASGQTGTGLGLTISREFVRLLGGAMQVQSRLGEGSAFRFSVPVQIDPGAALAGAGAAYQAQASAPAAPGARLDWRDLQALGREPQLALRSALQQLDMRRIDSMLAQLRVDDAALAQSIAAMLAMHQYRELCELLNEALGEKES